MTGTCLLSGGVNKNNLSKSSGYSVAEKERFELSLRYKRTTPLAGAPLRPLGYFSICSVVSIFSLHFSAVIF